MTINALNIHHTAPAQAPGRAAITPSVEAQRNAVAAAEHASRMRPTVHHEVTVSLPEITDGKLQLAIDRDTGRVIGKIVDKQSGELLRQIPTEEILRLIAATEEELGPLYTTDA
jgi:flagellar protein FlaG